MSANDDSTAETEIRMASKSNILANNQKYRSEHTKMLGVRFYPADMFILDYINANYGNSDSKMGKRDYIKSLVVADMIANGVEIPEGYEVRK